MRSSSGIVPDAVIPEQYSSVVVELLQVLESAQNGKKSTAIEMLSKLPCEVP